VTVRKRLLEVCVVWGCVMLLAVVAVQSARGATSGFTCALNGGVKDFSDSLCTTAVTEGTGEYGHVAVPPTTSTTTEALGSTVLKSTTGGVTTSFTATSIEGSGTIENLEPGGVAEATGTGTLTFRGMSANHECKVNGSSSANVTTVKLKTHTVESGLKLEPASGTKLMSFILSGCSIGALNREWTLGGSVIGTVNGAKVEFAHTATTVQGTLLFEGTIAAGLAGTMVLRGGNGNALAFT